MGQRKPYNPNTKYGRKKIREQVSQGKIQYDPDAQRNHDNTMAVIMVVIIIVVMGFGCLFGCEKEALKYLSR